MSAIVTAIEKVLGILGQPEVRCLDYWDSFDKLWNLGGRENESATSVIRSDQRIAPLIVIDTGSRRGEWVRWTSPADLVIAILASLSKGDRLTNNEQFVILETNRDLTESQPANRFLRSFGNSLPWVEQLGPRFLLRDLLEAAMQRTACGPTAELAESIARVRLGELLSPGNRHHISNLVAPLLICEGLREITNGPRPPILANCFSRILDGERGSTLHAVAQQINTYYEALGQNPPFADLQRRAPRMPTIKGRLPEAFWPEGPLRPVGDIGVLLLDDRADLGYASILQAVLLGSCSDDSESFRHVVSDARSLSIRFDATQDPTRIVATLSDVDDPAKLRRLPEPLTLVNKNEPYQALFLDLRLEGADEDERGLDQISGVKIAAKIGRRDPSFPIVLFSSTQQQAVFDQFEQFPNVIADFRKPAFSGYVATLDKTKSAENLIQACERLVSLLKMRFLYEWMSDLSCHWITTSDYTWNERRRTNGNRSDDEELSLTLSSDIVEHDMLNVFRQYLQRGFYMESILYSYQVIEARCDGAADFSLSSYAFQNTTGQLASVLHEYRFRLFILLLTYCFRCRNLSAHGALRQAGADDIALEDEAVFTFAVSLTGIEQLMFALSNSQVVDPMRISPQAVPDASTASHSGLFDAGTELLRQLYRNEDIASVLRRGRTGPSEATFVKETSYQDRVFNSRQLSSFLRLAVLRARIAREIWANDAIWNEALPYGLLVKLELLWIRMIEHDVKELQRKAVA